METGTSVKPETLVRIVDFIPALKYEGTNGEELENMERQFIRNYIGKIGCVVDTDDWRPPCTVQFSAECDVPMKQVRFWRAEMEEI